MLNYMVQLRLAAVLTDDDADDGPRKSVELGLGSTKSRIRRGLVEAVGAVDEGIKYY